MTAAIVRGQEDMVRALLEPGAGGESTNEIASYALMEAAERGNISVVKLLLSKGANVNYKRGGDGNTALIEAAREGHLGVVKLLLKKGASVNEQPIGVSFTGFTALMWAAARGDVDMVKVLLAAGANPILKDSKGRDALKLAEEHGHTAIGRMLKGLGAK